MMWEFAMRKWHLRVISVGTRLAVVNATTWFQHCDQDARFISIQSMYTNSLEFISTWQKAAMAFSLGSCSFGESAVSA